MNLQPTLENGLVKIRPLLETDFESLYEAANDPKIWEQHPCKRNERVAFEKFFADSLASKGAVAIIDIQTNNIIGSSRFNRIRDTENAIEIGWTFLSRNYWGGTYNRSVKELMIEHAFNFIDYIALYIDKSNIRSQQAAKKVGAILVDEHHSHEIPNKSSKHLRFIIARARQTY